MTDKKPRRGSRAWEEARRNDPAYIRATVADLARQAEGGSQQAVAALLDWLAAHPDLRSLVRQLDNLATKTERAWVDRLGGAAPLARKAVEDELAGMKAGLLGPAPSVTDKILASTVLLGHLGFQRAAQAAALPTDSLAVRAAREKLLAAAQKRVQDAVRGWQLYADKTAKGVRPAGTLKLFEPAHETA